jgi:hypothetical protein
MRHWVKLVEAAAEAKKKARYARYAISLGRVMDWTLGKGGGKRGVVPVAARVF